jgi:hypothetical protein
MSCFCLGGLCCFLPVRLGQTRWEMDERALWSPWPYHVHRTYEVAVNERQIQSCRDRLHGLDPSPLRARPTAATGAPGCMRCDVPTTPAHAPGDKRPSSAASRGFWAPCRVQRRRPRLGARAQPTMPSRCLWTPVIHSLGPSPALRVVRQIVRISIAPVTDFTPF